MSATETDIELLEQYLDRELEPAEARRLELRVAADEALAGALDQLRQQREMVGSFFATLEDDEAAERMVESIQTSIDRRRRFTSLVRTTRWASAVAACLAIGALGLFVGRGMFDKPAGNTSIVTNTGNETPAASVFRVELTDADGRVVAVQECASLDEAQRLAGEIAKYQEKLHEVNSGQAMPTLTRF